MKLKIALLQLLPGKDLTEQTMIGKKACEQAKAMGAHIALLPEMWSSGYYIPQDEKAVNELSITVKDDFVQGFRALAADLEMAIGITFLEKHEPKPLNSIILFDRKGQEVLHYSKVHTCAFADEKMLSAGEDFYVMDLDVGEDIVKVGSMICFDREFPESARILMLKGAEVVLAPNACPMEINRLCALRTRAYENKIAIATCNYPVGQPDCNGHSTVFDGVAWLRDEPGVRDMCILEAPNEEGIYIVELDMDLLRDYREHEVMGERYRHSEKYGAITEGRTMIGLKRGTIKLCDHEKEWEKEAQDTIIQLKNVLGDVAKDIQHVGSTSIPMIKAKPIIDIAVAVDDFKDILALEQELKSAGFYYRPKYDELGKQLLFASGSYYEGTGDLQTHFIHVVHAGGMDWINYINFRDYLNHEPSVAKEYECLKLTLASQAPVDSGREKYTSGKHDFIVRTLRKALVKSFLGKTVNIKIDRPMGSRHPRHPEMIYPVNYGFIPNVYSGDGAELDVYLLGVNVPVREYTASVIGIIYREDDVEDKLVAAPNGIRFSKEEIQTAVNFQEQFFKYTIEVL